jgi:hypothetical protein
MSTLYGADPPREGRAAPVEKSRPRREAAPSKTAISATGNQGPYTRPRGRVQAPPFDAHVDALIRRDPRGPAAVLAEFIAELGIRATLEDRVFRRARLGQAPQLVWRRP